MNFPILSSITLLPVLGAIFILIFNSDKNENKNAIYVSLFTSFVNLFLIFFPAPEYPDLESIIIFFVSIILFLINGMIGNCILVG